MGASKKARRAQRSHYRVATTSRPAASAAGDAGTRPDPVSEDEDSATRPVAAVAPSESSALADTAPLPAAPATEPPTVILTPEQVALLAHARLPQVTLPSPDAEEGEGYAYQPEEEDARSERPTIILDVAALLAAPPPAPPAAPRRTAPDARPARPRLDAPPHADVSFPQPDASFPRPVPAGTPTRRRDETRTPTHKRDQPAMPAGDHDEELARLRRLRLAREAQEGAATPQATPVSEKLRQWWHDMRPSLDRVLGRTHRAGSRGARATAYQTSASLPAVRVRSVAADGVPAVQRLSATARGIGERAQTAAGPALTRLHTRAEHMAQQIVDHIDERLGSRPPLQHVLLGPGRMIVSFAPNVTIRDAQIIISSVQARTLRRLVGYNAYLVLVPPGREARYAERLHAYRQVTGVHFGPQRPSAALTSPDEDA
jgi:hypothetical protein